MSNEHEESTDGFLIPRSELRQLAGLLSGSAQIIERILSSRTPNGHSREGSKDLEAQVPDIDHGQETADIGFSHPQVNALLTSESYHEMNDNEQRVANIWKAIEESPRASEAFEQLLNLWINLHPRRDEDDVSFRRMYLDILPSDSSGRSSSMVSELGPQLALLKHRRHRLRAPKSSIRSLGGGTFWIGIALNDLLDGPRHNITKRLCEVTVGQALDACHQKTAMPPILSQQSAVEKVKALLDSLHLVSLTTSRDLVITPESYPGTKVLSMSLQQALDFFSHKSPSKESTLPRSEDSVSFRKLDLNVETLREIGRLKVEWTPYLDQHLQLDVTDLTLYIFWFGTTYFKSASGWWNAGRAIPSEWMGRDPNLHPEMISYNIQSALGRSYLFLFNNPTKASSSDISSAYRSLPVPWWVEDYYDAMGYTLSKSGTPTMADVLAADLPLPDDIKEGRFSKHVGWEWGLETQAFEQLGPFEDRVRILDAYMKSKKPSTLRGLWRDKRDSLQWYTLWVVIIFGGVSRLLGLFGVALTAAQTAAAFQQLE